MVSAQRKVVVSACQGSLVTLVSNVICALRRIVSIQDFASKKQACVSVGPATGDYNASNVMMNTGNGC